VTRCQVLRVTHIPSPPRSHNLPTDFGSDRPSPATHLVPPASRAKVLLVVLVLLLNVELAEPPPAAVAPLAFLVVALLR